MRIDLGCGRRKREGFVGVDCQALDGVDVIADCNERLPFDDNVADEVCAFDFLEHLRNDRRIHIMNEIWRILKPGGLFHSATPSTDGRGAFQDPTHYSFWNENSFVYYTDDRARALYGIEAKFDVINLRTTAFDGSGVCHVIADLRAVK